MSKSNAVAECVSEDALVHLKSYKYSSVDKSYISRYILKHYWNAFVEVLPLWMAPNMVTLVGFMFILGNVGLLEVFMPDLTGPGPSWLYFSFAIGLWMYSTMDNVDGKQARRTGTSSGLGELFDHGIDSLNCTLASLLETAAMSYGATKTGALTALIPCLPMFFSTWETYHTHTLYLGYFNGPTEGLIIACTIMILSGIYGPQIWHQPISPYLSYLPAPLSTIVHSVLPSDPTFRDTWSSVLLSSFLFIHLPFCILNVARARRAQKLPILPVFRDWTPMLLYTGSLVLWLGSPYTSILSHNRLVLLCVTLALVFGRMTTKIILAHLTRQPFPLFTVMLVPLMAGAAAAWMPLVGLPAWSPATELWYLRAYFVFAAVVYARWAVLVVGSICSYLGINALTIPREKVEAAKRKRREEKEGRKVAPGRLEVEKDIASGGGAERIQKPKNA